MSKWTERLRQASFRGVPFAVLESERPVGRRLAVHEYPGRDDPYVEDLGRATRRMSMRGFLVQDSVVYGGGALEDQLGAITAAAEAAGQGVLVHPLLGRLIVSVERMVPSERWDRGRYAELAFEMIVSASYQAFGIGVLSTATAVLAAADGAASLLSGLFATDADDYVGSSGVAGDLGSVTSLFSGQALAAGGAGFEETSGLAQVSAALTPFRSAASGLGLLAGAGASTAAAATGVVRAISAAGSVGASIDSLLNFGGWG